MRDDSDEENLEVEKSKVFGKIVTDQTRRIDILGAENKLDRKKCIQEIKRLPVQNPKVWSLATDSVNRDAENVEKLLRGLSKKDGSVTFDFEKFSKNVLEAAGLCSTFCDETLLEGKGYDLYYRKIYFSDYFLV